MFFMAVSVKFSFFRCMASHVLENRHKHVGEFHLHSQRWQKQVPSNVSIYLPKYSASSQNTLTLIPPWEYQLSLNYLCSDRKSYFNNPADTITAILKIMFINALFYWGLISNTSIFLFLLILSIIFKIWINGTSYSCSTKSLLLSLSLFNSAVSIQHNLQLFLLFNFTLIVSPIYPFPITNTTLMTTPPSCSPPWRNHRRALQVL
jgi:hypothetical protein